MNAKFEEMIETRNGLKSVTQATYDSKSLAAKSIMVAHTSVVDENVSLIKT